MPDMELLKKKIKDSGIPITTICDKAGIERATFYTKIDGGREWKASEIAGLSNALHLKRSETVDIFLS